MSLYEQYTNTICAELKQELALSNIMMVPKIEKVTLNMGVGEALNDKKMLDNALAELTLIAGQKPVIARARKSVASFKLREGWPVGCKVVLRSHKMWDFLDRLVHISLPRIRDFRGLNPKSYDGSGNYNIGIREQIIFPEIDFDKVDAIRGMDIAITTSTKNDAHAHALLKKLQFPFRTQG